MINRELIRILQANDPEASVFLLDDEGDPLPVRVVHRHDGALHLDWDLSEPPPEPEPEDDR